MTTVRLFAVRVRSTSRLRFADRRCPLPGRKLVLAVDPSAFSRWGTSGLPSSSEIPVQTCPALRPRSRFRAIGLSALPLLPSALTHGVAFPGTFRISGLYDTACLLAVYASPRRSPFAVQQSLSAGGHLYRASEVSKTGRPRYTINGRRDRCCARTGRLHLGTGTGTVSQKHQ